MGKYLLPVAGVLAWSVGLAALSGFDAMEMDAAQQKITSKPAGGGDLAAAENIRMVDRDGDGSLSKAEFDAGHAVLGKPQR